MEGTILLPRVVRKASAREVTSELCPGIGHTCRAKNGRNNLLPSGYSTSVSLSDELTPQSL